MSEHRHPNRKKRIGSDLLLFIYLIIHSVLCRYFFKITITDTVFFYVMFIYARTILTFSTFSKFLAFI